MKPSKELEKEIMEYIFSAKVDHNECLAVWNKNPWEAVSRYEAAVFPHFLLLPLCLPSSVKRDPKAELDRDIQGFFSGKIHYETDPRAPEGEYELGDGEVIIVNRFGRIENEVDLYGEDEENKNGGES